MNQREKLIELLGEAKITEEYRTKEVFTECSIMNITDYLLANGVVVLPCRCGECEHYSVGNCPMWDNGGSKYDSHWNGQYDGYCHKAKRKGGGD